MNGIGENKRYIACPHCTMQMPADVGSCPHCELPVFSEEHRRKEGRDDFLREKGDWKKARKSRLFLLLILVPCLLIAYYGGTGLYRTYFGVNVVILENPDLPIRDVEIDTVNNKRVLRGTVLNNLTDVPAISLKSIGVKAGVEMKDGKVYVQTLFPVGPLNEPGALLLGDSGIFELPIPSNNVKAVRLGAEIIDLAGKKRIYAPGDRSEPK
jgi:hypothetical protein